MREHTRYVFNSDGEIKFQRRKVCIESRDHIFWSLEVSCMVYFFFIFSQVEDYNYVQKTCTRLVH